MSDSEKLKIAIEVLEYLLNYYDPESSLYGYIKHNLEKIKEEQRDF